MNMKNDFLFFIRYIAFGILLCCVTTPLLAADSHSAEKLSARYTQEHPVVIMSDWEFAPYEFRGDDGNPQGYGIEIGHLILDELNLPYVNKMAEWKVALSIFKHRKAVLAIEPKTSISVKGLFYSKMPVEQYRLAIVSMKGSEIYKKFDSLPRDPQRIFFKKCDVADVVATQRGWKAKDKAYLTTRQALLYVSSHPGTYYIWGYDQLRWAIRKMGITNLQITILQDIRPTPLCFASYDGQLIDAIDETYARLSQSGRIDEIHNKFFNPEMESNDASPVFIIIILVILAVILAFTAFNYLLIRHIRHTSQLMQLYQNVMKLAFASNRFMIQNYNLMDSCSYNLFGDYFAGGDNTREEFFSKILPEDRVTATGLIQRMAKGETDREEYTYHRINPETGEVDAINYSLAVAIKDKEGKTTNIVYTIKDITQEMKDRQLQSEASAKFQQIFSRSLVALALYDQDGNFIEANDEMNRLYQQGLIDSNMQESTNLFSVRTVRNYYDRNSHEPFCYCKMPENDPDGIRFYAEISIVAIFGKDEKIGYYTVSAYDITEERNIALDQRSRERNIRNVRAQLATNAKQLNDILVSNKAWLCQYDFEERIIRLYRTQGQPEREMSIEEYYSLMLSDKEAEQIKKSAETRETFIRTWGQQYKNIHKCHSPFDTKDSDIYYYSITGLPRKDEEGNITGCYGLLRDVTDYYKIHEHLREETNRANDSGRLKSAFLANMTHEIRTPLNAIVGFSDLLQTVTDPDERQEFIKIIHNNSDMLLRLINDILAVSEMDVGMLEIKPERVDFADVFSKTCESLSQRVDNPDVKFICENPCDTLIMTIDSARLQQVITNFVTNAVKYTTKGHIKLGYTLVDNGIRIYCEDTGAGIPEEKQASIFERFVKLNDFVQGTGLGLNICKGIAQACGGKIGVDSKVGEGSTFWIWIPITK